MSDELKKRLKKLKDKMGAVKDPRDKMTRRMKLSELDSYNEFVDKISQNIPGVASTAIGKMLGQAPAAFKKGKPVLKTGTKEKVKNLRQDMADGGVVDLTTEMEVNE